MEVYLPVDLLMLLVRNLEIVCTLGEAIKPRSHSAQKGFNLWAQSLPTTGQVSQALCDATAVKILCQQK